MNVPPSARSRRAGVALVLVLSILILLTAVVLAFFTNATTDLTNSKNFSDELRVRILADSAVNVAEGSIRTATQGGPSGSSLAWASQPGMIRTFNDQGVAVTGYKLYSSDTPQIDFKSVGPSSDPLDPLDLKKKDIPDDWNQRPSDFVDLNSPSIRAVTAGDPDGTKADPTHTARYPIVDGNNLVALGNSTGTLSYDRDADMLPDIEGFNVTPPASYDKSKLVAPNNNPVPMPVRWLYLLQNGQLEPRLSDATSGKASIADASKKNPVVGRIAYWADDDTSKLNINTASEGNKWGRPRAKNVTELAYGNNIPAQNEFQMFPGHPAKTSLSTVFNTFWPVPTWPTSTNYKQLKAYYELTPRISDGQAYGSAGGTQPSGGILNTGIPYDADRLYVSVDELMFNTSFFASNTPPNRGTRTQASSNSPAITPQFLETTRFFLTASNRAPEVTLFNTPRVSLWPLQALVSDRSPKDSLLAFCATIPTGSSYLYSFQRLTAFSDGTYASGDSPTLDFVKDKVSGDRNNKLYGYVQAMMKTNVPGLGGSFASKYGILQSSQILTEMVDILRSGVNTASNPVPGSTGEHPQELYAYTDEGQTIPLQPPADSPGAGTSGFGRYATVTEAAIDFFRCNEPMDDSTAPIQIGAVLILQNFNPAPGFSSIKPDMQIEVSGLDQFTIRNSEDPDNTTVKLGMASPVTNIVDAVVGGLANGNNTEYVGMETSFYYPNGVKVFSQTPNSGAPDSTYPFFNVPGTDKIIIGNGNLRFNVKTFDFNGDSDQNNPRTITVKIYSNPFPPKIPRELIQTLTIPFPPSFNLPVPVFKVGAAKNDTSPAGSIFKARIVAGDDGQPEEPSGGGNRHNILDQNDVVRSVVVGVDGPSKGDLRFIAGMKNVPKEFFHTHPLWDYNSRKTSQRFLYDPGSDVDVNWRFAHSLKTGDNPGWGTIGWYDYAGALIPFYQLGASSGLSRKSAYTGSLLTPPVPSISSRVPAYSPEAFPAVPVGLNGAQLIGRDSKLYDGDWDTGQGALEDGPYINKPDEINGQGDASAYYSRSRAGKEKGNTYSPNREVASGVIFGSLPTGIDPSATNPRPWQTLLFTPFPAAGRQHPGFGVSTVPAATTNAAPAPPYSIIADHAILDLFTMPIVEPYALSEPLSTQGKVNMNYQMAPFAYIKRDTAVRAVLKSVNLMAIPATIKTMTQAPDGSPGGYKSLKGSGFQYRYSVNPDETNGTLRAFEDRFATGDIFHSASEICEVPLVASQFPTGGGQSIGYDPGGPPADSSYATLQSFWDKSRLTGDNLREEPYNDLYPRLTTKSNTYTVHVRVQTLKKTGLTAADTFVDPTDPATGAKDAITAEYRGSYQIERYIDPGATTTGADPTKNFPDYAATFGSTNPPAPLSDFYKFHTIGVKQF